MEPGWSLALPNSTYAGLTLVPWNPKVILLLKVVLFAVCEIPWPTLRRRHWDHERTGL